MGIIERAEIISKMILVKSQLILKVKKANSSNLMGDLFKVCLAYKFKRIITMDLNNVLFKKT